MEQGRGPVCGKEGLTIPNSTFSLGDQDQDENQLSRREGRPPRVAVQGTVPVLGTEPRLLPSPPPTPMQLLTYLLSL